MTGCLIQLDHAVYERKGGGPFGLAEALCEVHGVGNAHVLAWDGRLLVRNAGSDAFRSYPSVQAARERRRAAMLLRNDVGDRLNKLGVPTTFEYPGVLVARLTDTEAAWLDDNHGLLVATVYVLDEDAGQGWEECHCGNPDHHYPEIHPADPADPQQVAQAWADLAAARRGSTA